jgi:hypothetical protein
MNARHFALQVVALVVVAGGLVHAQTHEAVAGSSVQLGDKVVVIPAPAGFEEASTQFKEVKDRFIATEAPINDFLLAHFPIDDCQALRNRKPIDLSRYTKVAVLKEFREKPFSDADMTATLTAFRTNGGALLDPDGPTMKRLLENASRNLSSLEGKQIDLGFNATENLGEFDVRPEVFSVMLLFTSRMDSGGTQSITQMLSSLSFLKVRERLVYVMVYRKISSPAALKTELKPSMVEVKQFTTKWVNEILAANKKER